MSNKGLTGKKAISCAKNSTFKIKALKLTVLTLLFAVLSLLIIDRATQELAMDAGRTTRYAAVQRNFDQNRALLDERLKRVTDLVAEIKHQTAVSATADKTHHWVANDYILLNPGVEAYDRTLGSSITNSYTLRTLLSLKSGTASGDATSASGDKTSANGDATSARGERLAELDLALGSADWQAILRNLTAYLESAGWQVTPHSPDARVLTASAPDKLVLHLQLNPNETATMIVASGMYWGPYRELLSYMAKRADEMRLLDAAGF